MFTGIVEEIGVLRNIKHGEKSSILTITAKKVLVDTKLGDSICTNGVCLTVTRIGGDSFDADVMAESMRRTNLGNLKPGNRVNLERALRLCDRLGGHIVSGHVDGTGNIKSMEREDNAVLITVESTSDILDGIVEKGSIAIDGTSLTVTYVDDAVFKVSIIPHTGKETILLSKSIGDTVNLENDVIGKYVKRFTCHSQRKTEMTSTLLNEEYLKKHGFM